MLNEHEQQAAIQLLKLINKHSNQKITINTNKSIADFLDTIENHNNRTAFNIWSEGYDCTGQSSGAMHHGIISASSFNEACTIWANQNDERKGYFRITNGIPIYWGCQMFDNEVDARKSFG